jgi:hypothetical protein
MVFTLSAIVPPKRVTEIKTAGIGGRANGGAAQSANDSARTGATGQRAYGSACARPQKAAGNSAVARGRPTGRQRQGRGKCRGGGKFSYHVHRHFDSPCWVRNQNGAHSKMFPAIGYGYLSFCPPFWEPYGASFFTVGG